MHELKNINFDYREQFCLHCFFLSPCYFCVCYKQTKAEGDDCGTPGVDCPQLRCAVFDCGDGMDNSWGCNGKCTWIENSDGDLVCSGYVPQDVGCDYGVCGTKQGLLCDDGFNCRDDTTDDCVLGKDADCAGWCIECTKGVDCDDDATSMPKTTTMDKTTPMPIKTTEAEDPGLS